MAASQELEFKPYVGRFFKFKELSRKVDIGKKIYGNYIHNKISFNPEELPKAILILDEKRNFVRFLGSNNELYWTRKTQIRPASLPTYDGNPLPVLDRMYDFLVYCTDTRLRDFRIDTMSKEAMELLPKITALIDHYRQTHTTDKK